MEQNVRTIRAGIWSFLIRGERGAVLIDSGPASARRALLRGLTDAGVRGGDLSAVVITHGDLDHTGNARLLRQQFGASVLAHPLEAALDRSGTRQSNRKPAPDRMPWVFRVLLPIGRRFGAVPALAPDVLLEDGQSLATFGVEATVLHLPGHTRGSIGVLTPHGDLFCGDLFWNVRRPRLHPLIDDLASARASVERLKGLPIRTIHPAHGGPFPANRLPSV